MSAVINKFEEFLLRIQAQGKEWDGALKALFAVLLTMKDTNLQSAILAQQNKYLEGTLTKVSELSNYAVMINMNLVMVGAMDGSRSKDWADCSIDNAG